MGLLETNYNWEKYFYFKILNENIFIAVFTIKSYFYNVLITVFFFI